MKYKKIGSVLIIMIVVVFVALRYIKTNKFFEKENNYSKTRKHGYSRFGVINEDGKEIVPPIYYSICDFYNGYIKVKMKNRYGIIDSTGRIIAPVRYYDVGRFNANLAPVRIKNKWAFIDKTGKQVTDFRYDYCEYAEEGFYSVKLNGKWGYINSSGKEITSIKYMNSRSSFRDGILAVCLNHKWGYINSRGQEITRIKYDYADEFKNGRAQVSIHFKEGLIDKNGKEIVPLIYDEMERLDGGFVYVGKNTTSINYIWGVINEKTGTFIAPLQYHQTFNMDHPGFSFTKKIARISLNNKVGVINEKGKIIIPLIYDAIDALGDICAVYKNNKYGYINSNGKVIVPVENDYVDKRYSYINSNGKIGPAENEYIDKPDFFNDVCGLNVYESSLSLLCRNGKFGFANKKGRVVTSIKYDDVERRYLGGAFVSINKKCGYVNEKGKEVIPARFDIPISKMSDYFDEGLFVYKENNKWGAIDTTGVNIIEPKYDSMTSFTWGFSIATIGRDSYIIDKKGKASKTLKYDKIIHCRARIALVSINGKWGMLSKNNKLTTPIKYDEIEEFRNGFAITEMKFNKYGFPITNFWALAGVPNLRRY
jgi:hypothetical protein